MIQKNDTDKNKGGRPAKGLSEKRKYRITVKMATGEYYALKSKARKAGVSASEMVRQAVDGIQGVVSVRTAIPSTARRLTVSSATPR